MDLTDTACYQALISRDTRFDGRFFAGVLSTGIYCRPVCPARKPLADNCRYFASAAEAEAAGFRPCLKCRPELAPGQAWSDSANRLAKRAEEAMRGGDFTGLEQLAAQLGVTDRHLRRTFSEHFGVTPVAYVQTQRLLLAKKLLAETALPVTAVAMAAGFGSVRRMNSLFASRYRLSPSQLRRTPAKQGQNIHCHLSFRPPLDWQALLRFLAGRAIEGVEKVENNRYWRTVSLYYQGKRHQGWLSASCEGNSISVTLSASLQLAVAPVLSRLRHLFDLDASPADVERALGNLVDNPGLRAIGAFDGFEMAVRAILGQQITVAAARTLAGRVAALGERCQEAPAGLSHYFPDAQTISQLAPKTLGELGVLRTRSKAILALAEAVNAGLDLTPAADIDQVTEALQALPGIGPWTASYIAMRALHWPDAWPENDYGLKTATAIDKPKALAEHMATFSPWRAYATQHLWSRL
ncbi:Ada metal-binding domain-containing protein [Gallaecimonas mangrovi]|uniref:Ada metal-binding domain-containing protein n=1 Tax=Gallaecimonas mangrovi TaxID=2291597 RepID=UPI000E203383|nr:Ada metal-binding domain-containing protein [Gallaecimonas mangrovi]